MVFEISFEKYKEPGQPQPNMLETFKIFSLRE